MTRSLRIALASYRAHPEVGGQGVYVRELSATLAALGHDVTVFAGPPYPALGPGVHLEAVPSLDLYRPDDPFRRPALREFKDAVDVLEYAAMCTAAFPEPLTFSLRLARVLRGRAFDVLHDNQGLGYGLLGCMRHTPLVGTIHHPISIDRRLALEDARSRGRRFTQRRWYAFVRMQARVARRLPRVIAVSEAAKLDIVSDLKVDADRIVVIPNGVDPDLFRPEVTKVPGRLVAIASSDMPSKGLDHLAEAVAKLVTEDDNITLSVIGRGGTGRRFAHAVERYGIAKHVRIEGRVDALTMVRLLSEAEVGLVPSLYEGFSLPAVEMMACALPVVSTTGGALAEVVGDAGVLVPPGDAGALAGAVRALRDPGRRAALGRSARSRVLDRFTWRATAEQVAGVYRETIDRC